MKQDLISGQIYPAKLKSTTTLSTIKKVAVAFLIGRFQPFHNGHKHLIDFGLQYAEKVIVLVGSSNKARSLKNPWTYDERKAMIQDTYIQEFNDGNIDLPFCVEVEPLPDVKGNDDAWLANVQNAIWKHMDEGDSLGVIGFKKDTSSYYLDLFPEAAQIILEEAYATLNATELRTAYIQPAPHFPTHLVPKTVLDYMVKFYNTEHFKWLLAEKKADTENRAKYGNGPFLTCDAVCTQMGKILLVERDGFPGKGQLALPGGFVEAAKGDSFENVLHELSEEANITDDHGTIPRGKLRGFYTGHEKRYDDPERSTRGHTLTTAFRFKFPSGPKMFTVYGGDDAKTAKWYPINFVKENPDLFFEDHYEIITEML
jgi:bifunctional NMN adenylyltransferase/nudix hydrolase